MEGTRARMVLGVACAAVAVPVAAQQQTIEEIIVTGSYIKRESFDLASPITVVDQEALKAQSTPALGEVVGDILKDGASALYGTEAVAGVLNVVTRSR